MIIEGDIHVDHRGTVRFVNDFNMSEVIRMYSIEPKINTIRAWQGHQKETKWFFVAKGSFLIQTVEIDQPKQRLQLTMHDGESKVLEIPGGHYNGFKALEKNSVLMVFSNFDLKQSKEDDHRETLDALDWNIGQE
jgi:dTDP-4-dehydrorhamnose 3,5-epimerase